MLVELRLSNLAVAADVAVPLSGGLNVLTGSTGAGKSLVVEAIRWVRGEKIDPGLLRAGETTASATAIFDLGGDPSSIEALRRTGVDVGSDGIVELRRQWKDGRSQAWIDGRLTSATMLTTICDELIEVQSQHQQLALLDHRAHARLLDDCSELRDVVAEYKKAREEYRRLRGQAERAAERHRATLDQADLLRYQLRELEGAGVRANEMAELRAEVARLEGGAQLAQRVDEALRALEDEEGGALGRLQTALSRLNACSDELEEIVEARDDLAAAIDLADETRRRLESFRFERDDSPEHLDEKQSRLSELEQLCRKYSRNENELIQLQQRLRQDVDRLDLGEEIPAELARALEEAGASLRSCGEGLLRARRKQARRIEKGAVDLLGELGMPGAALRFEIERGDLERDSVVRLFVRTNPGESFGPIENTASGGELSRIGLVLRSLIVHQRQPTLLLLDEVDAGLGADLGPALARRLRALSDSGQVLVITHLPAVAAAGDSHLLAEKSTADSRTTTTIRPLAEKDREEELLRMIGGSTRQARVVVRQLRADAANGGRS